jgi:hypothetical protein
MVHRTGRRRYRVTAERPPWRPTRGPSLFSRSASTLSLFRDTYRSARQRLRRTSRAAVVITVAVAAVIAVASLAAAFTAGAAPGGQPASFTLPAGPAALPWTAGAAHPRVTGHPAAATTAGRHAVPAQGRTGHAPPAPVRHLRQRATSHHPSPAHPRQAVACHVSTGRHKPGARHPHTAAHTPPAGARHPHTLAHTHPAGARHPHTAAHTQPAGARHPHTLAHTHPAGARHPHTLAHTHPAGARHQAGSRTPPAAAGCHRAGAHRHAGHHTRRHHARHARPYALYDSVHPAAIPPHHKVAVYATGSYAAAASQVVGRGRVVWIDVNGTDPAASALDVEPGDATPASAAIWAWHRLHANRHALARIYTMRSEWGATQAAIARLPRSMRSRVRWWIADPTGVPHLVPGSDATQWYWGPNYDISLATPRF